jgi:beta-glucosidase-like glycosyl hydrolase
MMGVAEYSRCLAEEKNVISEIQPSGVIYFKRNVQSPCSACSSLHHEIYQCSDQLPLIGIDQEGGWVARLGAPFTVFPGNDYLGRAYLKTKKDTLTQSNKPLPWPKN